MKKLNFAQKVCIAGYEKIAEGVGYTDKVEIGICWAIMHPAMAWIKLVLTLPFTTVFNILISPISGLLNAVGNASTIDEDDYEEYFEAIEEYYKENEKSA